MHKQIRNRNVIYEGTINSLKTSELEQESLKQELDNVKENLVRKENVITFREETSRNDCQSSTLSLRQGMNEDENYCTRRLAIYLLSLRRLIHRSLLPRTVRKMSVPLG